MGVALLKDSLTLQRRIHLRLRRRPSDPEKSKNLVQCVPEPVEQVATPQLASSEGPQLLGEVLLAMVSEHPLHGFRNALYQVLGFLRVRGARPESQMDSPLQHQGVLEAGPQDIEAKSKGSVGPLLLNRPPLLVSPLLLEEPLLERPLLERKLLCWRGSCCWRGRCCWRGCCCCWRGCCCCWRGRCWRGRAAAGEAARLLERWLVLEGSLLLEGPLLERPRGCWRGRCCWRDGCCFRGLCCRRRRCCWRGR
jgi:hypothetical protein